MIKIGIIGTRARDSQKDLDIVHTEFIKLFIRLDITYHDVHLISGGCGKGGDRFAEVIARELQIPITIYYAAWDRIGKSAGYKRNITIAKESDYLIACVSHNEMGGTWFTVKEFMRKDDWEGRLVLC